MAKEMKIGEKIEETEYILHCPDCGKNSTQFAWIFKKDIAICPLCKGEISRRRVKVDHEIQSTLERLK